MKTQKEFNELLESLRTLTESIKKHVVKTKIMIANCPF